LSNENTDACIKADHEAKHSFLYLFRTVNALIYVDLKRELHIQLFAVLDSLTVALTPKHN